MVLEHINEYLAHMRSKERAAATIEKYRCALVRFDRFLARGRLTLSHDAVCAYREELFRCGAAAATVNGALSALSGFFHFIDRCDCCVCFLRTQRSAYRDPERDLTRGEFERLKAAAERSPRLYLILETLAGCGIRVGELPFITVEAAECGEAVLRLKGKTRRILLPGKLCRKLRKYARQQKIRSGPVFRTRSGRPVDRRQVWAEMKRLCAAAHVDRRKVFPHNLRHLFAVEHYRIHRDIATLADILGHSSINTTRIYLKTSGEEHRRQLERMKLVS